MDTNDKYIASVPLKDTPETPLHLKLKDKSVTTGKLALGAVTNDKLANSSVDWDKLDGALRDMISAVEAGHIDENDIDYFFSTRKISDEYIENLFN